MRRCKAASTPGYVNSSGQRKSKEGNGYPVGRWECSLGSQCTEEQHGKLCPGQEVSQPVLAVSLSLVLGRCPCFSRAPCKRASIPGKYLLPVSSTRSVQVHGGFCTLINYSRLPNTKFHAPTSSIIFPLLLQNETQKNY